MTDPEWRDPLLGPRPTPPINSYYYSYKFDQGTGRHVLRFPPENQEPRVPPVTQPQPEQTVPVRVGADQLSVSLNELSNCGLVPDGGVIAAGTPLRDSAGNMIGTAMSAVDATGHVRVAVGNAYADTQIDPHIRHVPNPQPQEKLAQPTEVAGPSTRVAANARGEVIDYPPAPGLAKTITGGKRQITLSQRLKHNRRKVTLRSQQTDVDE